MNNAVSIDVQRLRDSVDIAEVVGRYVDLKRAGKEFKACCPFHSESTPSFTVNKIKGFYHCFGCGAHGDAIDFIRNIERVEFVEACEILGGSAVASPRAQSAKTADKPKKEPEWIPVLPVPDNAQPPPRRHPYRGEPLAVYPYRDTAGNLLGYTYRLPTSDGSKTVEPLVYASNAATGEMSWRWLSFPKPRPLYGAESLPGTDGPVLLVEGEKCRDAGAAAQDEFPVVTWPGGTGAAQYADLSPLAGRMVIIWPDCDSKRERLSPAEKAAGIDPGSKPYLPADKQPGAKAAAVLVERLRQLDPPATPYLIPVAEPGHYPKDWDIADEVEAGLTGAELVAYIRTHAVLAEAPADPFAGEIAEGRQAPPRKGRDRKGKGGDERPEIRLGGGRLVEAMREAEEILFAGAEPPYFQRGGMLMWINRVDRVRHRGTEEVIERGALELTPVDAGWLRGLMMDRIRFVRWHDKAQDWLDVNLPEEYPKSYLARRDWWVPVLRAVVEAPFVRADGTIAHRPGYDPASGVYLDTAEKWKLPPERKKGVGVNIQTDKSISWAKEVLEDLFDSFSPEAGTDMAVLIAALLTALQKTEVGASPGVVITAPVFGCGKGKLADIISIIATGRTAPMMTLPVDSRGKVDEQKFHDKLGSALMQGDRLICIDEVRGELDSASLDSMMTQETVPYRVLGASKIATLRPLEAMYMALGNNMRVRADASRRWVGCYLNPGVDDPHLREGLRDTVAYARKNRVKIVAACLALLHAFRHAGAPNPTGVVLGSYERWAANIAACVVWAGYPNPVDSQARWRQQDEGKSRLAAILEAWFACYGDAIGTADRGKTVGRVVRDLTGGNLTAAEQDLYDAIMEVAADKGAPSVNRLGKYLSANAKRVVEGYWIEPVGEEKHAKLWRVFRR